MLTIFFDQHDIIHYEYAPESLNCQQRVLPDYSVAYEMLFDVNDQGCDKVKTG